MRNSSTDPTFDNGHRSPSGSVSLFPAALTCHSLQYPGDQARFAYQQERYVYSHHFLRRYAERPYASAVPPSAVSQGDQDDADYYNGSR